MPINQLTLQVRGVVVAAAAAAAAVAAGSENFAVAGSETGAEVAMLRRKR